MKLKKKEVSCRIDTSKWESAVSTASELEAVHQGGNRVREFKKKKKNEKKILLNSAFSHL